MENSTCLAHIAEDGRKQPVAAHHNGTAALAASFAENFHAAEYAMCIAGNHDAGKCSDAFQQRLLGGPACDHTTAGAQILCQTKLPFAKMLAYCIAGHHAGLMNAGSPASENDGTLYGRLNSRTVPDYTGFGDTCKTYPLPTQPPNLKIDAGKDNGFVFAFFIRMLFSCLTDADFLDTESFMQNAPVRAGMHVDFQILLERLHQRFKIFKPSRENPELFHARNAIRSACEKAAQLDRGLFSLTVPTGAGKTLSSLSFALHHLQRHHLRRIVYVIPYTSIIEQNAAVFMEVLGEDAVLEHHSNYDFDANSDYLANMKKLACENWDMPVVVTTNVQFFESLFSNKPSRCRKLHNIAGSVIVFDEVQMIPVEYLKPCLRAVSELIQNYNCSAVLCSATQPAVSNLCKRFQTPIHEICSLSAKESHIFKRVQIIRRGPLNNIQLLNEVRGHEQCLVIVNTKKHAKTLFETLHGKNVFHLTTSMCPKHRKLIIAKIKKCLKEQQSCKVIATQLIEAGVDVDFPIVYRAKTGLDSILQSAGRCNREGKMKVPGKVHVFEPDAEYMLRDPDHRRRVAALDEVCRQHTDITGKEAIQSYFEILYHGEGTNGLDRKNIVSRLDKGFPASFDPHTAFDTLFNFDFADIADDFRLIDQSQFTVIIPYDADAITLLDNLKHAEYKTGYLRRLQVFSVQVYEQEKNRLLCAGQIDPVVGLQDIYLLRSLTDYSPDTGLTVQSASGMAIFC